MRIENHYYIYNIENKNNRVRKNENKNNGSRNSAVGIATGYGLDDREFAVRVPVGSIIFF
jgi:hypothetical protein